MHGLKPMSLAERVRQARERAGLSQQALAVRAGLSLSALVKIEGGRNEDPRLSTVRALSAALGVAIDDLVDPPERTGS
jgi:transcriptional regulator with XRE-family HTH domain